MTDELARSKIGATRTRLALSALLVLVLALVAATNAPARGRDADVAAADTSLPTPARTLAALDCDCTPSAALVARYRVLLGRLTGRCRESPGRLAYISKTATEILRQNGRRRTNLWLLTEVDRRLPRHVAARQPCRYLFALVVTG